ncbi:uncharacterized protein N7496_010171 [Penicillium cataractarum]|uniref:Uncharacterized protein n=1 Tax=Penicillium cataractarum TaxID=2100454 RepID=A0A9W9RQB2_9EURO|nr:uncharacterized protein N7496_010171 [Penicillium cataractarum]KAJ5364458.1 hypothetical protein N7496_010171 [Penicillium cataractarum]
MSTFLEDRLYLLGLEWAKFQIGIWMHFKLPHLIDASSLKKEGIRKVVMTEMLPYDEMLVELRLELLSLEEREPASFQFYRQIGAMVIRNAEITQGPFITLKLAQNILYRYLNRCHAEIWKGAVPNRGSPSTMGSAFGDSSHDFEGNDCDKSVGDSDSTQSHFYRSPDELRLTQQTYDDFVYTSALKEMGDMESCVPRYTLKRMVVEPPKWRAIVQYRDLQSFAEASSKKAAKHSASKSLWFQMGKSPLEN